MPTMFSVQSSTSEFRQFVDLAWPSEALARVPGTLACRSLERRCVYAVVAMGMAIAPLLHRWSCCHLESDEQDLNITEESE